MSSKRKPQKTSPLIAPPPNKPTRRWVKGRFCIVSLEGIFPKTGEAVVFRNKMRAKNFRNALNEAAGYKKYWVARGHWHRLESTCNRKCKSPYKDKSL